jgi:hypothetical protein
MHEMQDPVVGAAETVLREKSIGIAGEIAISEIEKFHAGNEVDTAGPSAIVGRRRRSRGILGHRPSSRRTF